MAWYVFEKSEHSVPTNIAYWIWTFLYRT